MICIELAVTGYLFQYLTAVYGKGYQATHKDALGIVILSVLEGKKSIYYEFSKKKEGDCIFPIKLSLSFFEKYGCHISDHYLCMIQKYADDEFRRHLFHSALINRQYFQIPYKTTIDRMLAAYGISEDELSYSTIRKAFNRKKTALSQRLIFKNTAEPYV